MTNYEVGDVVTLVTPVGSRRTPERVRRLGNYLDPPTVVCSAGRWTRVCPWSLYDWRDAP